MYRFLKRSLGCFTLFSCAAFTAQAATEASVSLKQKLATIDSLQANFQQKVTDINGKLIQQGNGIFAIAHPNKFYWHLTDPDESLIVADGQDVWIYNPFAEEVTVLDLSDAIKASPITLLVNQDEATWSQYQVTASDDCYDIKPKDEEGQVTQVSVCFQGGTLSKFKLADEQGNLSEFNLSEQQVVAANNQGIFVFSVPADVDLDDQRVASR